jgi:DNA-binding FadR family transcriptional regulator
MPNRSSTKTTLSRPSPPAPSPPRRQRAFRSPRAAELLAAHFRQRIIRGELKEGDRLPKQQDLMEEFGISRSTFREAFLLLESEGLLSVLQGTQGAVIHRPNLDAAARQVNFIMQSRNVTVDDVYLSLALIEPVAIHRLAERATREDVAALRKLIKDMYDSLDDDKRYEALAAQFHTVMVERAGLASLVVIMELLGKLLGAYVEAGRQELPRPDYRESKIKVMRMKDKLVDLIEKRDADGAQAQWKKYFTVTREFLLRWKPAKLLQDVYKPF